MTTLQKGQTIRCVDTGGFRALTEGRLYEVTSVTDEYVWVRGDDGQRHTFFAERFVAAEPGMSTHAAALLEAFNQ